VSRGLRSHSAICCTNGNRLVETFRDIFKPEVEIEDDWDFLRLVNTEFPGGWKVWKREGGELKRYFLRLFPWKLGS